MSGSPPSVWRETGNRLHMQPKQCPACKEPQYAPRFYISGACSDCDTKAVKDHTGRVNFVILGQRWFENKTAIPVELVARIKQNA